MKDRVYNGGTQSAFLVIPTLGGIVISSYQLADVISAVSLDPNVKFKIYKESKYGDYICTTTASFEVDREHSIINSSTDKDLIESGIATIKVGGVEYTYPIELDSYLPADSPVPTAAVKSINTEQPQSSSGFVDRYGHDIQADYVIPAVVDEHGVVITPEEYLYDDMLYSGKIEEE